MNRIIIAILVFTCLSFSAKGQSINDTITNWQLYKGSELLLKNHDFSSIIQKVEIKTSDRLEDLIVRVNYCTRNEVNYERHVWFQCDDRNIYSSEDKAKLNEPFIIRNDSLSEIRQYYSNKPIAVFYKDSSREKGILIGILEFK